MNLLPKTTTPVVNHSASITNTDDPVPPFASIAVSTDFLTKRNLVKTLYPVGMIVFPLLLGLYVGMDLSSSPASIQSPEAAVVSSTKVQQLSKIAERILIFYVNQKLLMCAIVGGSALLGGLGGGLKALFHLRRAPAGVPMPSNLPGGGFSSGAPAPNGGLPGVVYAHNHAGPVHAQLPLLSHPLANNDLGDVWADGPPVGFWGSLGTWLKEMGGQELTRHEQIYNQTAPLARGLISKVCFWRKDPVLVVQPDRGTLTSTLESTDLAHPALAALLTSLVPSLIVSLLVGGTIYCFIQSITPDKKNDFIDIDIDLPDSTPSIVTEVNNISGKDKVEKIIFPSKR